jgi:hypothetical protein
VNPGDSANPHTTDRIVAILQNLAGAPKHLDYFKKNKLANFLAKYYIYTLWYCKYFKPKSTGFPNLRGSAGVKSPF